MAVPCMLSVGAKGSSCAGRPLEDAEVDMHAEITADEYPDDLSYCSSEDSAGQPCTFAPQAEAQTLTTEQVLF